MAVWYAHIKKKTESVTYTNVPQIVNMNGLIGPPAPEAAEPEARLDQFAQCLPPHTEEEIAQLPDSEYATVKSVHQIVQFRNGATGNLAQQHAVLASKHVVVI
jgi:hypothetical protein